MSLGLGTDTAQLDAARLYDLFHQGKDYDADARRIRDLLVSHGVSRGRILEGACGTGSYLGPLSKHYQVLGFDADPVMVQAAQLRMPRAQIWEGDLRDFELRPPVHATLMLFGALCYLSLSQVRSAAQCMHRALRPGGLALVEPWVGPGEFVGGEPHMAVIDRPSLKVVRQVVTRREAGLAHVDFHYLVAQSDLPVQHLVDANTLHLHLREALLEAVLSGGFVLEAQVDGLMAGSPLWVLRAAEPLSVGGSSHDRI
ncbi:MAG: SAM-dependent methyltransferase [Cognaticolwellia sp.]|jgi:SAM-dependent methyltransferase